MSRSRPSSMRPTGRTSPRRTWRLRHCRRRHPRRRLPPRPHPESPVPTRLRADPTCPHPLSRGLRARTIPMEPARFVWRLRRRRRAHDPPPTLAPARYPGGRHDAPTPQVARGETGVSAPRRGGDRSDRASPRPRPPALARPSSAARMPNSPVHVSSHGRFVSKRWVTSASTRSRCCIQPSTSRAQLPWRRTNVPSTATQTPSFASVGRHRCCVVCSAMSVRSAASRRC